MLQYRRTNTYTKPTLSKKFIKLLIKYCIDIHNMQITDPTYPPILILVNVDFSHFWIFILYYQRISCILYWMCFFVRLNYVLQKYLFWRNHQKSKTLKSKFYFDIISTLFYDHLVLFNKTKEIKNSHNSNMHKINDQSKIISYPICAV